MWQWGDGRPDKKQELPRTDKGAQVSLRMAAEGHPSLDTSKRLVCGQQSGSAPVHFEED